MNATQPDSGTRFPDAALRVIREKGYRATTEDDLCGAAGLTNGSFFHHFATKEALGLAVADYFAEMQGAFRLAKAARDPGVVRDSPSHLRRYMQAQLGLTFHPTTGREAVP